MTTVNVMYVFCIAAEHLTNYQYGSGQCIFTWIKKMGYKPLATHKPLNTASIKELGTPEKCEQECQKRFSACQKTYLDNKTVCQVVCIDTYSYSFRVN